MYQDTPCTDLIDAADAGFLRAIATDIEQDENYVHGALDAKRLRLLADELDDPIYAGVRASLRYALANVPDGEIVEVEFKFVTEAEASDGALTPEEAAPLLAATTEDGEYGTVHGAK